MQTPKLSKISPHSIKKTMISFVVLNSAETSFSCFERKQMVLLVLAFGDMVLCKASISTLECFCLLTYIDKKSRLFIN